MKPDILETLGKTTEDKSTVPETLRQIGDGVWLGSRQSITGRKVHTVVIPVQVPQVQFDHANLKVLGDGKLLENREVEPDSWHRSFYNCVVGDCGTNMDDASPAWGDGEINIKDTGGTIRSANANFCLSNSLNPENGADGTLALVANSNWGIVVGTGSDAIDIDDHALVTQVAHGVAAGELYYATSPRPPVKTYDGGTDTLTYELTRYFDNFEGGAGTITLNEMAQYQYRAAQYIMFARDLIGGGLAVPFRAQAAITYVYSLYYPNSGSPLRNFFNYMFSSLVALNVKDGSFGNGYLNVKDTGGVVRSNASYPITFYYGDNLHTAGKGYMAAIGDTTSGILVGTDNTAVTFEDYALGALIAHGVGGGQLQYSVSEVPVKSWADPVLTVAHGRTFDNGSGGSIAVVESCMVARMLILGSATYPMTLRDVFSAINVANGESLRIVYQLKVTFP